MAVFCSVCGTRIYSAAENEGGFQVSSSFKSGWDFTDSGKPQISNTCESCGPKLREAVAQAAMDIADRVQTVIAKRKAEVQRWKEEEKRREDERREIEERVRQEIQERRRNDGRKP